MYVFWYSYNHSDSVGMCRIYNYSVYLWGADHNPVVDTSNLASWRARTLHSSAQVPGVAPGVESCANRINPPCVGRFSGGTKHTKPLIFGGESKKWRFKMLKTSEDLWLLQHKSVKSKSRPPLDFGGTALVASRQTGKLPWTCLRTEECWFWLLLKSLEHSLLTREGEEKKNWNMLFQLFRGRAIHESNEPIPSAEWSTRINHVPVAGSAQTHFHG